MLLAACGRYGFDSVLEDGPTTPPANYAGQVGIATCGGANLSVTVTQPIPAGSRLVASVVLDGLTETGTTQVTDTGGSPWARDDEYLSTYNLQISVWSAQLAAPLPTGAIITAQFPQSAGSALVVDAIQQIGGLASSAHNQANSKGWNVTAPAVVEPALVYCVVADHARERLAGISWVVTADFLACGSLGPGVRLGPEANLVTGMPRCSATFARKTAWTGVALAYTAQ
jgi:hypothetical protein